MLHSLIIIDLIKILKRTSCWDRACCVIWVIARAIKSFLCVVYPAQAANPARFGQAGSVIAGGVLILKQISPVPPSNRPTKVPLVRLH